MKSILFLVLLATASAIPSAVVLSSWEIRQREFVWLRANPSGFVMVMTANPKFGLGNSMRPLIVPGDRSIYEAYVHQKVKGEVILIDRGSGTLPVSHLCIDETEFKVRTKGINNDLDDGWTSKAWVKGVMVGLLRKE